MPKTRGGGREEQSHVQGVVAAQALEGLGSIPGLGRTPGERKGHPLQYSGLENSTDCIIHGVGKS